MFRMESLPKCKQKKKNMREAKEIENRERFDVGNRKFFFLYQRYPPKLLERVLRNQKNRMPACGMMSSSKRKYDVAANYVYDGGAHECIGLSGNNVRRISGDGCGTRIGEDRIYALGCAQKKKSLRSRFRLRFGQ